MSANVTYVFLATEGAQIAVSNDPKGENLPIPKRGIWQFCKPLDDVALDPRIDNSAIEKLKLRGFWVSI